MNRYILVLVVVFCLMFSVSVFAEDQTMDLTTYYPAPYGDYDELYTNYLDFNNTDYTESGTPNTPTAVEGRIWYNSTDQVYKFSGDGSTWKKLGSGGGVEVRYESDPDPDNPENGDMWLIIPDPS